MKAFVIDVSICNGCYCCQIACKDEHVGNDGLPYARPQPDTGQFWMKLKEYIQGTFPKVKMHYIPVMCMHCDNAPCLSSCLVEGAIYKGEDGLIIIHPEKCTGCAHLLDNHWKEPRCVDACPTGALRFVEETELKDMICKSGGDHTHLR